MAGFVMMFGAAALLIYAWVKSTDEAKKERERAANSSAAMSNQKLDAILTGLTEIKTDLAIVKDRGKR